MPLYAGLDVSTQAVKFVALDASLDLVHECSVNYDIDLPQYGTSGGVYRKDHGVVVAPTAMFLEALDLLFERLRGDKFPFGDIAAISGSGQQHGSVYWIQEAAETILPSLDASASLVTQLDHGFAVPAGPIWMDSSTTAICRELEAQTGGKEALCKLTGSVAYERFTGNQIAKLARENRQAYENSARISLISSFTTSVLVQNVVPIDVSDGSGMNLMDLEKREWDETCLAFADADGNAENLRRKLGKEIVPSCSIVGNIGSYFVARYGFSPDCKVVAFAGDNPSSLCALPLRESDLVISLGTSDTAFLSLPRVPESPLLEASLLAHPIEKDGVLAMLVYKNGSLVRQAVRDREAGGSWERFDEMVSKAPPGCEGRTGFFCVDPEILPAGLVGIHRFHNKQKLNGSETYGALEPRAVVESRFLDMRLRAEQMGIKPSRIVAVGGGSKSTAMLQVAADVFGIDVYQSRGGGDAAAVGGCTRAAFAIGGQGKFEDLFKGSARELEKVCHADSEKTKYYAEEGLKAYMEALDQVLNSTFSP